MAIVLKQLVNNNICSIVPRSNGDKYIGSFDNMSGSITYFYMITFKTGTQARGHIVTDFKLYTCKNTIINDLYVQGDKPVEVEDAMLVASDILKELLKGF